MKNPQCAKSQEAKTQRENNPIDKVLGDKIIAEKSPMEKYQGDKNPVDKFLGEISLRKKIMVKIIGDKIQAGKNPRDKILTKKPNRQNLRDKTPHGEKKPFGQNAKG